MEYTITHTNGDVLTILGEATPYNTENDYTTAEKGITFLGPHFNGYGRLIANNFLHLLENNADITPPTQPITGQLWWDKSSNILNVFDGTLFKGIANTEVGVIEPTTPNIGDQWWDTSVSQLKAWDGTTWAIVGPLNLTLSSFLLGTITNAEQLGNIAAANYLDKTVISNTLVGDLTIQGLNGLTVSGSDDISISSITSGIVNITSQVADIELASGISAITLSDNNSTITINQAPTIDASISTKKYVDDLVNDRVYVEGYIADGAYTAGTVVVFGGADEITVSTQVCDPRVAGVITTVVNPFVGLPVALMGRVTCKVIGPVVQGDILVNSEVAGVARALVNGAWVPGCVVGKSIVTDSVAVNTIRNIEISVGKF